jgi:starvation-inducible DNA-binding protein
MARSKSVSKSIAKSSKQNYSSSTALSTPTDLSEKGAAAVVQAINPLIADSFALYMKTKNFHWHLSGSHFRDYHLMLDEQADQILESTDPLAERVRKLGGTTLRSISHVTQTQTLQDDNESFVPPLEMLHRLMEDNKAMAKAQRAAHEVCDDNRDFATASLLEIYIDETERRTWFLFEAMQGGEHTK